MQNADDLTKLLSRIIRKNEPELADFNVFYLRDVDARRAKVSITEKKLLIPRNWKDIDVILEGLAPLVKKARTTMELEATQMDSKIAGAGIAVHQAIEFLESTAPNHLVAILLEAGFVREVD